MIENAKELSYNSTGRGQPMNNADAVKKYHAKLDEFKIRPYAEEGQKIRDAAAKRGMSVQGLFLEAVREYIQNHPEP